MRTRIHVGICLLACAVAIAAGGATAQAAPAVSAVGARPQLPLGARALGSVPQSAPISITVLLAPPDPAALQSFATAVSTPGSAEYHQFLSVAQFRARFAPSDAQIAAVRSTLSQAGLTVSPVTRNGLSIDATGSAADISHAFSTSLEQVRLAGGRVAYANNSAPTLPAAVASDVQGVLGLDSLTRPRSDGVERRQRARRAAAGSDVVTGGPQGCPAAQAAASSYGAYTADQLASAYDFGPLYQQDDEGQGVTVGLFELEPFSASDLAAYQQCYGTNAQVTNRPVNGGVGSGSGSGEAILDVETIVGLAPQAHVITYSGPDRSDAQYLAVFEAMVSDDQAQVLSTSWYNGSCDPHSDQAVTNGEATVFAEAAAQGQSMLTASGDVGSDGCVGTGFPQSPPNLQDPSGQSLITSVGGTSLASLGPPPVESTWNNPHSAGSSGGLSAYDAMPAYQLDAAPSLNVVNPDSSGVQCGAPAGEDCREAPDVSADADPYTGYVIYQGGWTAIGGTSASSPLWAALLALTDASSACQGVRVGFANPLLYQAASTDYSADFNDVTTGDNDVFGNENGDFPAGPGYDMATGLGTPVGADLAASLCGEAQSAVSVTAPGDQTNLVGDSVSLAVHASDATGATLTYSATGLPDGLSIDPTTGVISGTVDSAQSTSVQVTVRDAAGAQGATSFAWQVDDATSTHVSCGPAAPAGTAQTCTATVTDTSSPQTVPTGSVSFSASQDGTYGAAGSTCALSGGTCSVTFTPAPEGFAELSMTASYTTTDDFASSADTEPVTLTGASLVFAITAPSAAVPGTTFPVQVSVTDNGPDNSRATAMAVALPPKTQLVVTGLDGGHVVRHQATWLVPALTPGQSYARTLTFRVAKRATGTATIAGHIAIPANDPDTLDSTASATVGLG